MRLEMPFSYKVLAIIIAIILLLSILYCYSYNTIPAIIWTYWNNDTIPEVVQKCIDSWHHHNPTYRVIVLSPKNLMNYINVNVKDISFNDSSARESDIVRLLVLEKYGGIWSDATIFLTQPYPFSLTSHHQFIGYYLDSFTTNKDYPVLESWFFATVPNGEFITKWREAFFKLEEYDSVEEAVASAVNDGSMNSPWITST
jgi:amino acid permease